MTTVGEVRRIDPGRSGISPWRAFKARAEDWFDPELIARGKRYVTPIRRVNRVKIALNVVVDLIVIRSHLVPNLLDDLALDNWVAELAVAMAVLVAIGLPLNIPFEWWQSMVHDKRWEISTRTTRTFWVDQVKETLEGLVFSAVLYGLLWVVIRATDNWWLLGWFVFSLLQVGYGLIYMRIIRPIYNKFTPMDDVALHDSILAVAHGVGANISKVEIEDTSKRETTSNAYVGGFGPERRMVVCDTMTDWPHDEIRWVCGHEIGHWKLNHTMKLVPLVLVLLLANFGFMGVVLQNEWVLRFAGVNELGDPGALPLFLFVFPLPMLIIGPISMFFSRHNERQADLFGLEAVPDPASASASFRHLVDDNPSDLSPSLWRRLNRSHPEVAERLAMIQEWDRRTNGTAATTAGS